MERINFTKEHLSELTRLATNMLFDNDTISGAVGTKLSIQDLLHNTTINTLTTIHANLKKQASNIESQSEWTLTSYQQQKLNKTKNQERLVNLLIGYKKYCEQVDANKSKLSELKAKAKELQESTMTPQQQLDAINAEIAAAEKFVSGFDEPVGQPAADSNVG